MSGAISGLRTTRHVAHGDVGHCQPINALMQQLAVVTGRVGEDYDLTDLLALGGIGTLS